MDDKSAHKLLGDSFRRQLLMDGGFSTVSFICSKSDDISKLTVNHAFYMCLSGLDKFEAKTTAQRRI